MDVVAGVVCIVMGPSWCTALVEHSSCCQSEHAGATWSSIVGGKPPPGLPNEHTVATWPCTIGGSPPPGIELAVATWPCNVGGSPPPGIEHAVAVWSCIVGGSPPPGIEHVVANWPCIVGGSPPPGLCSNCSDVDVSTGVGVSSGSNGSWGSCDGSGNVGSGNSGGGVVGRERRYLAVANSTLALAMRAADRFKSGVTRSSSMRCSDGGATSPSISQSSTCTPLCALS